MLLIRDSFVVVVAVPFEVVCYTFDTVLTGHKHIRDLCTHTHAQAHCPCIHIVILIIMYSFSLLLFIRVARTYNVHRCSCDTLKTQR